MIERLLEKIDFGGEPIKFNYTKTHCRNGHAFSEENTYVTKTGSRQCKTCKREAKARRREREREARL